MRITHNVTGEEAFVDFVPMRLTDLREENNDIPAFGRFRGFCAHCGMLFGDGEKKRKKKICGRCRRTSYCCRECQIAHWQEHRPVCQPDGSLASVRLPSSERAAARDAVDRCEEAWFRHLPTRPPFVGGYWLIWTQGDNAPCYVPGSSEVGMNLLSLQSRQWVADGLMTLAFYHQGGCYYRCYHEVAREAIEACADAGVEPTLQAMGLAIPGAPGYQDSAVEGE
jgi:hypothetical protein